MRTHQFSREEFREIAEAYASEAPEDAQREFVIGTYRGDIVWQAYFIDWKNGSGSFTSSIPTESPQKFTHRVAKGLGIEDFQSGQIQQLDEDRFQLQYRSITEDNTQLIAWILFFVVTTTLLSMYLV